MLIEGECMARAIGTRSGIKSWDSGCEGNSSQDLRHRKGSDTSGRTVRKEGMEGNNMKGRHEATCSDDMNGHDLREGGPRVAVQR